MGFGGFMLNDPDANMEILGQPRYEGAINSIDWLTNVVDSGFVMYITFIAFFIISVAMLRNVLAGAYVAYPKFWDKVAQAHEEKREIAYYERVTGFFKEGWKSASGGSLEKFILRFVPNVKLWTDFAEAGDNEIAPKDYFMKAIPQMILVIIIGVFIYNGYYRDTANKITGVGADLFHRFVTEVDPTEVIYRITESSGTPDFASDDSEDRKMQLVNKISHDIYAAVLSKYNDIDSTAAKTQLAGLIEAWVIGQVDNNAAEYASSDKWDPKYKITLTTSPSQQKNSSSNDGNTQVVMLGSTNVKDFGFESTVASDENWFINVVATFNKQTTRKNYMQLNDVELYVKLSIEHQADGKDVPIVVDDTSVLDLLRFNSAKITGMRVEGSGDKAKTKEVGTFSLVRGYRKNSKDAIDNTKLCAKAAGKKLDNCTVFKLTNVQITLNGQNHALIALHNDAEAASAQFTSKHATAFNDKTPVSSEWPDDIFADRKAN